MAEYKSTGLFVESPKALVGEISHEHFNMSQALSDAIFDWIEEFDSWLNWDDPMNSIPIPTEIVKKFNERGAELTEWLQKELGTSIKVRYEPTITSE